MKRILVVFLTVFLFAGSVMAQSEVAEKTDASKFPFSIKAYPFRGTYLDGGVHWEKFAGAYPAGMNFGFELPSTQQRPWQQYLGNATVGVGLSWIDFGHQMLGHSVALYPYILLDAIDIDYFQMRFKVAGGPAAVTEHWYTQADQNPDNYYEPTVNTIFGCTINAYLNAGINLNVPLTRYLAVGGEFGFFHMSNGRTCMPNIGVNAIYGSLGVTATFNSKEKKEPVRFPDLPYGWAVNITGAAGAHKSAIEDPGRFLISTLHAGAVYHVNNWYAIGLGLDLFYNDAITKNTGRSLYCDGDFDIDLNGNDEIDSDEKNLLCTTCGDKRGVDYTFAQKTRAGLALNNEFKFGRVTAILDWGVYFYNPARNLYYDYHEDIYGQEDPKRTLL